MDIMQIEIRLLSRGTHSFIVNRARALRLIEGRWPNDISSYDELPTVEWTTWLLERNGKTQVADCIQLLLREIH